MRPPALTERPAACAVPRVHHRPMQFRRCVSLAFVLGLLLAVRSEPESEGHGIIPLGLTEEQLHSQWISKLEYAGPEGDFVMNLIFRLEGRDRFSIQARDRLGRTWWDLSVDGSRALSLDRRNHTYCTFDRVVEVTALPLGPLEFTLLPQLILGRLPFEPLGVQDRGEGEWSLQDERRRTWYARMEDGELRSWRLEDSGRPVIWWSRVGELMVLSAPREKLQLRWRNNPLQELATEPLAMGVPDGYARDCSGDRLLEE